MGAVEIKSFFVYYIVEMNLIQIKQIDGLTASLNSLSNSVYDLDQSISGVFESYDDFWDQHQWDSDHVLMNSAGASVGGYNGIGLGLMNAGIYVAGTGVFNDHVGYAKNVYATQNAGQIVFKNSNGDLQSLTGTIDPNYSGVTTPSADISSSNYILGVDTSTIAAGSQLNLPLASSVSAGKEYIIKDEGLAASLFNVEVSGSGGDFIDSSLSLIITGDGGHASLYSNGSNWFLQNSSGIKI